MATDKHTAEALLQHLTEVADARMRQMMGGYILYVDDIVIGQINEGELFIKVTSFGEQFAPELLKRSPYPGAKAAFVIPSDKLADPEWLGEFISGTLPLLPKPKPKRKGTR